MPVMASVQQKCRQHQQECTVSELRVSDQPFYGLGFQVCAFEAKKV